MLSLAALLSRGALLPFSDDEESYEPVNFGQADAADFLRFVRTERKEQYGSTAASRRQHGHGQVQRL